MGAGAFFCSGPDGWSARHVTPPQETAGRRLGRGGAVSAARGLCCSAGREGVILTAVTVSPLAGLLVGARQGCPSGGVRNLGPGLPLDLGRPPGWRPRRECAPCTSSTRVSGCPGHHRVQQRAPRHADGIDRHRSRRPRHPVAAAPGIPQRLPSPPADARHRGPARGRTGPGLTRSLQGQGGRYRYRDRRQPCRLHRLGEGRVAVLGTCGPAHPAATRSRGTR